MQTHVEILCNIECVEPYVYSELFVQFLTDIMLISIILVLYTGIFADNSPDAYSAISCQICSGRIPKHRWIKAFHWTSPENRNDDVTWSSSSSQTGLDDWMCPISKSFKWMMLTMFLQKNVGIPNQLCDVYQRGTSIDDSSARYAWGLSYPHPGIIGHVQVQPPKKFPLTLHIHPNIYIYTYTRYIHIHIYVYIFIYDIFPCWWFRACLLSIRPETMIRFIS